MVACLAQQSTRALVLLRSRAQLARTSPPRLVLITTRNGLVQYTELRDYEDAG